MRNVFSMKTDGSFGSRAPKIKDGQDEQMFPYIIELVSSSSFDSYRRTRFFYGNLNSNPCQSTIDGIVYVNKGLKDVNVVNVSYDHKNKYPELNRHTNNTNNNNNSNNSNSNLSGLISNIPLDNKNGLSTDRCLLQLILRTLQPW